MLQPVVADDDLRIWVFCKQSPNRLNSLICYKNMSIKRFKYEGWLITRQENRGTFKHFKGASSGLFNPPIAARHHADLQALQH